MFQEETELMYDEEDFITDGVPSRHDGKRFLQGSTRGYSVNVIIEAKLDPKRPV